MKTTIDNLLNVIGDYRETNADLKQNIASLLSLNAGLRASSESITFQRSDGREFTVMLMASDVTGERYLRVEVTGSAGVSMTCDKFLDVFLEVVKEAKLCKNG